MVGFEPSNLDSRAKRGSFCEQLKLTPSLLALTHVYHLVSVRHDTQAVYGTRRSFMNTETFSRKF